MYLMFDIVANRVGPLQDFVAGFFEMLGEMIMASLGDTMLSSFLVNGLIGGVGGVLEFVPQIMILFLIISFLEDCGYLARAAFVIDKIMNKFVGLHGKAFIPMLLGFGCGIPGIMATRAMENEKLDVLTIANTLKEKYNSNVNIKVSGNYRLGDIKDNQADLTKIHDLLGYVPKVNFKEGISNFVDWVENQEVEEDNYEKSIEEMKKKGLYK